MVDMDNVIVDTALLKYINEFLGCNYKRDEMKGYYLQELVSHRKEEFWNFVKDRNFYEDMEIFDDCYRVLERLNEIYDVYIVTAYLWKDSIDISGYNLRNKYYYLKEKLPFIKPEKYIFTTNKNIINFDIKIDDRLDNLEGAEMKLMFSAWHNKDLTDDYLKEKNIIRANNWCDIEKVLLENK